MAPSLEVQRDARERVLADYATVRKLMAALLVATRAALRDERQRPVLRASLMKLRAEVDRHLEYEERALCPLLRQAGLWGEQRAEEMAADHAAQRTTLAALARRASDPTRTMADLADEIATFVRRFERRIAEEHELLTDEAIGRGAQRRKA